MWLMTRLAIVFYVTITWIISLAVILFAFHVLDLNTVQSVLTLIYHDNQVAMVVVAVSVGIIAISVVLENLIYGRRRRERTIAFDNPSGPVAVSLSALEDLIKRLSVQVPEIKEIRPTVLAIKKGLDIEIKLTLRAEGNIPDLTQRLQELVKRKIEEAIGMEGKINIRVHVVKISLEDMKVRRPVQIDEPVVPFHGYRV